MTDWSIDWTKMIKLLEQVYIENLAMRDILTNRVEGFDWKEIENGVAEIQKQGEIHRQFDLLYRAARGDADFRSALQAFLKQDSTRKPN